jgi:hypothetical protein
MNIEVRAAQYSDVEELRGLFRQEANCQIIHDSFLRRGLAAPYLILADGRAGGYGAVSNRYDNGRLMEFYTLPHLRASALAMFRKLLAVSQATHIEAQTNISWMLLMLYDCARNITAENVLFHDASITALPAPNGCIFRHITPEEAESGFPHNPEPGEWVIEANDGTVVATGGFLCHYNPPYGDIYMEVAEPARRQGFGSYLVQELKRECYAAGKRPAARCNPANTASRRTLEKAGLLSCGRLLVGEVVPL